MNRHATLYYENQYGYLSQNMKDYLKKTWLLRKLVFSLFNYEFIYILSPFIPHYSIFKLPKSATFKYCKTFIFSNDFKCLSIWKF